MVVVLSLSRADIVAWQVAGAYTSHHKGTHSNKDFMDSLELNVTGSKVVANMFGFHVRYFMVLKACHPSPHYCSVGFE